MVKQDGAPSTEVMHAIETTLKFKWNATRSKGKKKRVTEMGVWFVVGFCSSPRGDQSPLVESAAPVSPELLANWSVT